jgi:hypothetical protein
MILRDKKGEKKIKIYRLKNWIDFGENKLDFTKNGFKEIDLQNKNWHIRSNIS